MLRMLFCVVLLVLTGQVWSSTEARLLARSSGGTTALFNLGNHDNIRPGDYAIIVKPVKNLENKDLRLVPAAKARNVKVNSDSSIWVLYRIYDEELLVKGDLYIVLSETSMLNGRSDPKMSRTAVVSERDKISETTIASLSSDDSRLAKLQKKYEMVAPLHEREYRADRDFELLDMEDWEKAGKTRYRSALYKSPHQDEFRREQRISTFEKMVTAYLKRVNHPDFNYESFYEEQMKSTFSNEFRVKSNFNTEYEDFIFKQSQNKTADAKIYRSILEKGESWSEEFSDEELERTLKQISVLQEKDRRIEMMSKPKKWGAFLDYGIGFIDAQSASDRAHRRDHLNSLDLSVELAPFLRHEKLGKFTFEASVRSNKTAVDANSYNANVDEKSMAGGINWYAMSMPSTYESFLLFAGIYVRTGVATLDAPTAGERSNYSLMALPGVKLGFKYNFRNGISLRASASFETLNLEQVESSNIVSQLPERQNLVDGKTGFGIGYTF